MSIYNVITNPKTGRNVSIYGNLGHSILNKYIKLIGGSTVKSDETKVNESQIFSIKILFKIYKDLMEHPIEGIHVNIDENNINKWIVTFSLSEFNLKHTVEINFSEYKDGYPKVYLIVFNDPRGLSLGTDGSGSPGYDQQMVINNLDGTRRYLHEF